MRLDGSRPSRLVAVLTVMAAVWFVSAGPPVAAATTPATTTPAPTTTTTAAPYCQVVHTVAGQWQQGFAATFTVTNLSGSVWTHLTLRWRYPGGQQLTSGWNGNWTQSGQWVTWTPSPWQPPPPVWPGQSVTIGIIGTGPANPPPTDFSVNGIPCS